MVAAIEDVDGDGTADFIVGASAHDSAGTDAGRVYVYSGASAALLYTIDGVAEHERFGSRVAGLGDVNNDGFGDFAVHASGFNSYAGQVRVYSGVDGSPLYVYSGSAFQDYFGSALAGAGDVNHDGHDDFLIGAEGWDDPEIGPDAGRVWVYSGQNGSVLYSFSGELAGDFFGSAVAGIGDVNEDGFPDYGIGARHYGDNAGRAYVFSGIDGSLIYVMDGGGPEWQFGLRLARIGDVDEDGVPDFGVSAFRSSLFSGADGSLISLIDDELQWGLPHAAGDFNGDGVDDVLVAMNSGQFRGRAVVFSGADGSVIASYTGVGPADYLGTSADTLGDVNADGFPDVIVGASDGGGPGYVHIFTGGPTQSSDINGDGVVNVLDLVDLLLSFGRCAACPADLHADGMVDVCDLGILLANWGREIPAPG